MIFVRKKNLLFKGLFNSLPAVSILIFSVLLTYNQLITWIENDVNLVKHITDELTAKQLVVSEMPDFAEKKRSVPDERRQIAGFGPMYQMDAWFPDLVLPAEKRFAGRFFLGFSSGGILNVGLCILFGVLAFFFPQKRAWNYRRAVTGRRFFPYKNRVSTGLSAMNAKEDVMVEEDQTLASVNSDGSTFAMFWRRCRNMRPSGARGYQPDTTPEAEYTDPLILFFKNNSAASMDMVRIISRLEREDEFLDELKTYAFRTALLLRDLGFQLPSEKTIDPDPLVETMLDYYAITVHGIREESIGISADETAKKAEEMESAARRNDLVFLAETAPVFLEYMEYFITGVVKLTEEKNIVNDRRLHSRRRISDMPRRFGKRRGKKSD
jgi:hypothetical protein